MSVVDVVLLLLMLVFVLSGYRQGFVLGITSLSGFLLGLLLGIPLGSMLAGQLEDAGTRVLVSLVVILGLALVGTTLAGWLGSRLRRTITSDRGRRVDDVGGAIVSLFAVLLLAWLIAVPLRSSSVPWLAASVRDSALLTAVDQVVPEPAHQLSTALQDNGSFPRLGDAPSTRARQVDPPDPALAGSQVAVNSRQSVVKVVGSAPACARQTKGSGFVYTDDRVMTNAHVVAGARSVAVELGGKRYDSKVVVFDPGRDLAVLLVPGLPGPSLRFAAGNASSGSDAIVLGFPLDGPYNAQPARIRDVDRIASHDIYQSGRTVKETYTVRALVRGGNSGGPLLSANGLVLGVIFAAAPNDPDTGFAVTAEEAHPVALAGAERNRQTATGECA
ncbi:MarP family serine protease [Micromonospora sp. NPDC051543]|uniref:MarP family serine protease n=1 Tax=Micromonospora sp. NPDC051543 TaxID=3364287 RepID=UPI0037942230